MLEFIQGGLYTSVQDYPGRVGYWNIGIPPSGPMDPFAFRAANILAGNNEGDAGLEITAIGPKMRFLKDTTIALTGAKFQADIDGKEVHWWSVVKVKAQSILSFGPIQGYGLRAYMAIAGGIDVPDYLGSKSTFPFGGFGGFEGRIIKNGDRIQIKKTQDTLNDKKEYIKLQLQPSYSNEWEIGVIPGPHSAPDFFTVEDEEMFYNTAWRVHYNSNRLGCRLEGPSPKFARKDGGEGGRHPSNLIDYAYAIGTVNFTGNMPVILTVDGPSLGGFVSIATIAKGELWKIGQARPNDIIYYKKLTIEESLEIERRQDRLLEDIR